MQRRFFVFSALLAVSFRAAPGQELWYLRTAAGRMLPAWFDSGGQTLELRVLDGSITRANEIRFDDAGFVELRPGAPARRWTLDGLAWKAPDGTQLIPAWVVPAGRGPGH